MNQESSCVHAEECQLHTRQPAVIHRDLKPSNILLGDRSGNSAGKVYLVDFGSVRTATNGSTITVVGTYGYMPPEQFGGHTTPASDLYALGATIICLATGIHPSELPHKDLRIDFVNVPSERLRQRVNLSAGTIKWLKSMTEPSVELRLKSASQALIALNEPNRDAVLTTSRQPFGSKIKSNITDRVFEISRSPKGFSLSLIPMLGVAIFWNGITAVFVLASLLSFASRGWMMLFFMIPFVWVGAALIWEIIFELFGTRKLRIDGSNISLSSVILGVECMASTAPQYYLDRVELVPLAYAKDAEGTLVTVPPYLNIWAGNRQFCLDKFNLTQPERKWLIHELTDWLDLGGRIQLHT